MFRKSFGQKRGGEIKVCCLEKSKYITELQDFQQLGNVVFYTKMFNPEVVPKIVFSIEDGSGSTRKTKVLCFHIFILQTVSNKQVLKSRTFFLS